MDVTALKNAARAAIVMPAVFAFADKVVEQPQTSLFAGICAHLLLWPPRRHADVRRRAAGALRAVADLLDAGRDAIAERARLARGAVDDLGRRVLGTQNRPSGPTAATAALASLPEELDWLLSFVAPTAELPPLEPAGPEEREAMAAAASVLGTSASTLDGRHEPPDFARLDAAREAVAQALVRRLPELPVDARSIPDELEPPFRIRAATFSARQAAIYALRAAETDQLHRLQLRSTRPSRSRSSTRASARSGSGTASVGRPGSRLPSSSPSEPASSTASGWCSGRSRSCGRTHSGPAGRSSARSSGPASASWSGRCS